MKQEKLERVFKMKEIKIPKWKVKEYGFFSLSRDSLIIMDADKMIENEDFVINNDAIKKWAISPIDFDKDYQKYKEWYIIVITHLQLFNETIMVLVISSKTVDNFMEEQKSEDKENG